ncbi:hypothetical protein ACFWIQ_09435 [Kitasatospora sp. NPDC127059]|uniref:hypothetical protein n=1 Tax=unclassified Kitasatospora TaxID=2633591 RepID=UPI0036652CC5
MYHGGGGGAGAAITCTVTGLRAGTVLDVTVPAGGQLSDNYEYALGGEAASVRSTAAAVNITGSGGGGGGNGYAGGQPVDGTAGGGSGGGTGGKGGTSAMPEATGGGPGTSPTCTAHGPGLTAFPDQVPTSTAGTSDGERGTITPDNPNCPGAGWGAGSNPPDDSGGGCVVIDRDVLVPCQTTGDTTACTTPGPAQYTVPAGTTSVAVTAVGAGGAGGSGGSGGGGIFGQSGADGQGGAGGGAGAAVTCTITGLKAGSVLELAVPGLGLARDSRQGGLGGGAATAVYSPAGVRVVAPGGGGGGGGYTGIGIIPGTRGTDGGPVGQGGGAGGAGGTALNQSQGGGQGTAPTCTVGPGLTVTRTADTGTAGSHGNDLTAGQGGTLTLPAPATGVCPGSGAGGDGGDGGKGGPDFGGGGQRGKTGSHGAAGCVVIVAS